MRKLLLIPAVFFGCVGIYGAFELISNPDIPNLITMLSVLLITALLASAALLPNIHATTSKPKSPMLPQFSEPIIVKISAILSIIVFISDILSFIFRRDYFLPPSLFLFII